MGKDSTLYIRIEEQEKKEFENLVSGFGMTPSQAVRIFIKKALMMRAIPFRVGLEEEKEDYESMFK
jgi:addiction module RelB/DinJ family antitoxin